MQIIEQNRKPKIYFNLLILAIFSMCIPTLNAQNMNEEIMKFTIPFANAQEEASFKKMGGDTFGKLANGSYSLIRNTPKAPTFGGNVSRIEGDGLPLEVNCSAITNQNLQCRADLPPVDFNLPVVVHSVGMVTKSALTIIPGNTGCPGDTLFIPRTYFNQDAAGSQVQCMQRFTIINSPGPVLNVPPNVTVDCVNNSTAPATTGMATVTGSCLPYNTQITFADVSTQSGSAGSPSFGIYTITRTWMYTDNCGRSGTAVQLINVDSSIGCPSAIPTMGQWGLIILGLLMVTLATVAIRKRGFALN